MCAFRNKVQREKGVNRLVRILAGVLCIVPMGPMAFSAPQPPPQAMLRVVNATSVPKISLKVNGRDVYQDLAQGAWTGMAPWDASLQCLAVDLTNGIKANATTVDLKPNTYQTLVIMGDFSNEAPAGEMPGQRAQAPDSKKYPPNVVFNVYSNHMKHGEQPMRFRFVNAMPRVPLTIQSRANGGSSVELAPGGDYAFTSQPKPAFFEATAQGKKFSLILVQKDPVNQTVVFYLSNGAPAYLAVTDDTGAVFADRAAEE